MEEFREHDHHKCRAHFHSCDLKKLQSLVPAPEQLTKQVVS